MEEGGEWRRRRRPHGSTTSVIPEWASLPPELVERVADCVLSTTGGVDAYMDMRAVCPTWRSAIAKPSPLAAFTDLRFRPRHWVMLDMTSDNHDDDDARLFLHVPTGRFRWLRLPELIDHALFGASDGLLVLADRVPPYHRARVLNPFTGDMLHLDAPSPQHVRDYMVYTSVDGEGATLVLLRWGCVFCAAPTSHIFTGMDYADEDFDAYLVSVINFKGNAYCADTDGHVLKFVAPAAAAAAAEHRDDELVVIAQVSPGEDLVHPEGDDTDDMCSYLVDSAGELLLVRYFDRCFKVFRVDLERNLLEKVTSLGGHRALFLGEDRCFSVDVDKLPSVDGDCIYLFDFKERFGDECDMCVYNLRDGTLDIISGENYINQPFSLVQVLLRVIS